MLQGRVITRVEELAELSESWDRLPAGRGEHADLYDSHAWFGAWAGVADASLGERLRVPAVFEGERLVGLLPMLNRPGGRWEIAGLGYRPRYRPIVGESTPREEVIDGLIEQAVGAGAREMSLLALPSRDPATAMLEDRLESAGFGVTRREGSQECLSHPEGDWKAQCARFKKYHRTVKNFSNKAARLGELSLESWGAPEGRPAAEGLGAYVALHGQGWKGSLGEPMARHRRMLIEAADRRGWSRLYLLSLSGVPTAAIVWFRIAQAAIAYSTVYDQRLAALSPGTIVMWSSHEQIWQEGVPGVVDYLPGRGAQKDQLGTETDPLITLDAVKSRSLISLAGQVTSLAGRAARKFLRGRAAPATEPDSTAPVEVQLEQVGPAETPGAVEEVVPDPALELYLTVAGGHRSPKQMKEHWATEDRWLAIGTPPRAWARLRDDGQGSQVEQIVITPGDEDLDRLLAEVAQSQPRPVSVRRAHPGSGVRAQPLQVHRAILPFTK